MKHDSFSAGTARAANDDDYFVRPAIRSEIPEISELIGAAMSAYKGEAPDLILELYVELSRNVAARWGDGEVLVAIRHGCILGTVTFYRDASLENLGLPSTWAGFRSLAVHPGVQGRGIGSRLVRRCLASAAYMAPTVGIHTGDFMRSARSMYEKMGFVRSPTHDLRASEILGIGAARGEARVLAYRLDLQPDPAR